LPPRDEAPSDLGRNSVLSCYVSACEKTTAPKFSSPALHVAALARCARPRPTVVCRPAGIGRRPRRRSVALGGRCRPGFSRSRNFSGKLIAWAGSQQRTVRPPGSSADCQVSPEAMAGTCPNRRRTTTLKQDSSSTRPALAGRFGRERPRPPRVHWRALGSHRDGHRREPFSLPGKPRSHKVYRPALITELRDRPLGGVHAWLGARGRGTGSENTAANSGPLLIPRAVEQMDRCGRTRDLSPQVPADVSRSSS
jgi:hypothetical protein